MIRCQPSLSGLGKLQILALGGRRLSDPEQRGGPERVPRGRCPMLGVVATIKVKLGMEQQFEAVAK
jgi:hypothetical protein